MVNDVLYFGRMTEGKPKNVPILTINTFDDDKNTRLHFAAAIGDTDVIWGSLKDGHKIDPVNYLGWTPLMMATRNGHLDAAKTLIEQKADATKKNRFGSSVFLMAVTAGNLDLICLVLQHLLCGGVSKQSMEATFSPITFAVLFGHEHVVQYLLDQSFHINHKTIRSELTPVMFAAAKKDSKLISFLASRAANFVLKNVNNQTAQDILNVKSRKNRCSPMQPPAVALPPPLSPLIFLNQPCMYLPPQRKSSDLVFSPSFTPVSPINFVPQIFFPMDFSPSGFASPMNSFFCRGPNDAANARISSPNVFLSPMVPNNFSFMQSPCPNGLQ